MKSSLRVLTGFSIETTDGIFGKIKDFLVDAGNWDIRFLVVEFGNIFSRKKILIPPSLLGKVDWEHHVIPIRFNERDIARYSTPKNQELIAHEYAEEMKSYYGLDAQHAQEPAPVKGTSGNRPEFSRSNQPVTAGSGPLLKARNDLKRYSVRFRDGKTGRVQDLIAGLGDWKAGYMIVRMQDDLPEKSGVILPVHSISKVNTRSEEVSIQFSTGILNNLPVYHSRNESGAMT